MLELYDSRKYTVMKRAEFVFYVGVCFMLFFTTYATVSLLTKEIPGDIGEALPLFGGFIAHALWSFNFGVPRLYANIIDHKQRLMRQSQRKCIELRELGDFGSSKCSCGEEILVITEVFAFRRLLGIHYQYHLLGACPKILNGMSTPKKCKQITVGLMEEDVDPEWVPAHIKEQVIAHKQQVEAENR